MRKRTLQLCFKFVLCLAGALPAVSAAAQSTDIIAVFDIDSSDTSIDQATMARLNNYMYGRLASAGFKLTPQDQVRERVVELKRESHKECYDQSCQIELGKTLSAQKSLASRLIQIGNVCLLQSVIYDLRTETSDKGADGRGPCTVAGIMAGIDQVVAKFKGEVVPSGPSIGGRVETGQLFDRGADIVNVPTDESGFLVIHSNPSGATIFINGKEVGLAPLHLEYPAGHYVIVAEVGRLYHPARQEVNLTARQSARVTFDLLPAFGTAKITSSPPNAQVWLDGDLVGQTNLEIPQKPSGTYKVRLQSPDYLPSEGELVIKDGKTSTYHADLVANWGQLRISSNPPGATVFLDGAIVEDKTPCVLDRVKPGVHVVKYFLDGHGERSEKVNVRRGQRALVSTKLQPKYGLLVVTCSYPGESVCECNLWLDYKLVGQTPWLHDVLAMSHRIEVRCPNGGTGGETVTVAHNGRSDVNVSIYVPPPKPPPPPPAPRMAAPEPTPSYSYDKPKSSSTSRTRSRAERTVFFPLTLSISEGILLPDKATSSDSQRAKVQMGLDLDFHIKAIYWLVPGFGFWVMLEPPHEGTFRPGIQWYFGRLPMYIRTAMMVKLASSSSVGFVVGYGADLSFMFRNNRRSRFWDNGILVFEFQTPVWSKTKVAIELRIGIGYRF
ncbi:MAG: PEGA domain-containing protein [Myxococcota bacterium]|jgi:hypothetical protein